VEETAQRSTGIFLSNRRIMTRCAGARVRTIYPRYWTGIDARKDGIDHARNSGRHATA